MDDREWVLRGLLRETAFELSTPSATVWYGPVQGVELQSGAFVDRMGPDTDAFSVAFCQVVARDGDLLELADTRVYLGHPIEVEGRIVGAICVADRSPRTFTAVEHRTLAALAREIGDLFDSLPLGAVHRPAAA